MKPDSVGFLRPLSQLVSTHSPDNLISLRQYFPTNLVAAPIAITTAIKSMVIAPACPSQNTAGW